MIKINGKEITRESSPFIIAEVGINHNGDIEKAFKMIEVAKEAGADCVKFQTFKATEFVADANQMFTYKSQGIEVTESMLEMFQRYEFNEEEWIKIKQMCDKIDIMFLSTPQNLSDLNILLKLGIKAIKIGSDDFTNLPLIRAYRKKNLPLILSCGMANLAEIYTSLEVAGAFDGYPVILLLCTSEYPTPPESVNLLKLKTLANAFPELILGFSDHTQGALASSLAVCFGAVVFEKHFTLDNDLPGPDHWFAENPNGLKTWVASIKQAYTMLGNHHIKPTSIEEINKKEFRRYIVAKKLIKRGELYSEDNLTLLRVSNSEGLLPFFFDYLVGKPASKDFKSNEIILL